MIPYLKLAALGVGMAFTVAIYHNMPIIGPGPRMDRLKEQVADWKMTAEENDKRAKAWEVSFRKSEALRDEENRAAQAAINETAKACDARVAKARKSGAAIRKIIEKEPRYDASNCPVRERVSADLLRDAINPSR